MLQKKQIILATVMIFLFSYAVVTTAVTALSDDRLSELHQEELVEEKALQLNRSERAIIQAQIDAVDVKIKASEDNIIRIREERAKLINSHELPRTEKPPEKVISVAPINPPTVAAITNVDMDKLAYAIRMAETGDCTKGYGLEYNNCYGIKNGSIAPCEEIGRNRMCMYKKPEDSTEAFKQIWIKGYGGQFPSYKAAQVWTGSSNPQAWINNVSFYYNK